MPPMKNLEEASQRIQELEGELKERKKDLSVLVEEVLFAEKETEALRTINLRRENEIKKLKDELAKQKDTVSKLSNNDSQSDVNQIKLQYNKEIKILSERNKTIEEQMALLGEENENLRSQVVEISQALDVSEKDLVNQRNLLSVKDREKDENQAEINKLSLNNKELEDEFKRGEEKREKYRKEAEVATMKRQELMDDFTNLRNKYDELLSQYESEKSKPKNEGRDEAALLRENKELRDLYSKTILEMEETNQAFAEIKRQLLEKQDLLNAREIEKRQIEEENHNLTAELSAFYAKEADKEKEKENSVESSTNLNQLLNNADNVNKTVSIIQEHLKESSNDEEYLTLLNSQQQQIESLLAENDELKKSVRTPRNQLEVDEKIRLLKEEVSSLKKRSENAQFLEEELALKDETLREKKEQIQSLERALMESNSLLEDLKSKDVNDNLAQLEKEKAEIQIQCEMYQYEIATLTTDYNQLLEKSEEIAKDLDNEKDAHQSLIERYEKLLNEMSSSVDEEEIKFLQSEVDELKNMNLQLQDQADELVAKLKKKYEEEESSKLSKAGSERLYKEKISNLEMEIEVMKEENSLFKERIDELEEDSNLRHLASKKQELIDALEEKLETTQQSLNELNSMHKKELQDAINKERSEHISVIEEMKKEIELLLEERKDFIEPNPQTGIEKEIKQASSRIALHNEVVKEMQRELGSTRNELAEIHRGLDRIIDLLKSDDMESGQDLLRQLHDIAIAMDAKTKLLDTRIQLNISVEFNRKMSTRLEEKETLLQQAVEYVNNLQKEYNQCKESLKRLIEERSQLKSMVASNQVTNNESKSILSSAKATAPTHRAKSTERGVPASRSGRGYVSSYYK